MYTNQPIIDVTPIEQSSERTAAQAHGRAQAHSSSRSSQYRNPTWKTSSSGAGGFGAGYPGGMGQAFPGSAHTRFGASSVASKTPGSVLGGMLQIGIGLGLVTIGIPMLILPGPGLLAIGGGLALAANGARKVFA